MKKKYNIVILIIFLSITIEFSLRFFLGFCDAPLYISDESYEYIAAPNQNGKRFGNTYSFNSFSQRSKEVNPNKTKILGLGDSVIYGGVQSDQDSIATSIVNKKLPNLQMLNISSGSWGPDNCSAYLKKYGTFNAKAMLLVVSSHDAFDVMDFQPVVGNHISYPKQQYQLAWWELLDRYVNPRITKVFSKKTKLDPDEKANQGIEKNGINFNPGFDELKLISRNFDLPLIIYLHPEKSELQKKKYNAQGGLILNWATKNEIKILKGLDYNFTNIDYRDVIHLSNSGQKKLAEIMINELKTTIKYTSN
ncbi:hypothetical protein CLV90_0782 [Maribacter spongiicola]|uniref:GDSL-like lipase/acylhydrolase family protein n=1 Tax=Maribacter spongiicola TaxID=1206753 RepID=A0A4R7K9Q3_9FLAO|nr:hypothetical protein [Maribacter spongiicola]TDT46724.1 hypothetical protein CLV90_0782 [Maribacter spongiicola]